MYDFSKIGKFCSLSLDTDYIDIKRDYAGKLEELYSNIKCHFAFKEIDNPNPETIDVKPIIQGISVNLDPNYDVRNNDYIICKRMNEKGELMKVYQGRCGNPLVVQGRQRINVLESLIGEEDIPTPPPPINVSVIKIDYEDIAGNILSPQVTKQVSIGEYVMIEAKKIEGYNLVAAYLDGLLEPNLYADIESPLKKGHEILFEYESDAMPDYLRILVLGLFTEDDGSLSNGYHLYKRVSVTVLDNVGGTYVLKTDINKQVHGDTGRVINFSIGVKLKLYPTNEWVMIMSNPELFEGGYKFEVVPFVPTTEEMNAYETHYYDGV